MSFYQLNKNKKKEQQILYQFGSATVSVWSCSSDGSTASVSEWDSPSDHQLQLSWSVLEAVRLGWRRSVGLASVSICSPLPSSAFGNIAAEQFFGGGNQFQCHHNLS